MLLTALVEHLSNEADVAHSGIRVARRKQVMGPLLDQGQLHVNDHRDVIGRNLQRGQRLRRRQVGVVAAARARHTQRPRLHPKV